MAYGMNVVGALLGSVSLAAGCSSGAQGADTEQSGSLWRASSTELVIESSFIALSPLNGAILSQESSCSRYPRSQMNDEQLTYLRTLEPVEIELRGLCDAGRTTVVTVVEADGSSTSFKTDDSTAGCRASTMEIGLPASIKEHFGDGLPCVTCGPSAPCAEGVCVSSVCVN